MKCCQIKLRCRYAHYDNKQTFSDFAPFGGWTVPYAKQYMGDVYDCGYVLFYIWVLFCYVR